MSVRLFVGNLAFDVTEAELRQFFSAVAPPSQVRLPTDRETGKPRGFAFVDFEDRAQAEEAIRRLHQQVFKGRPIAVNEARARDAVRPSGPAGFAPRSPAESAWAPPGTSDLPRPGQPRGTFGPDAPARGKRRPKGQRTTEERAPKGPVRERGGGQLFRGAELDEAEDAELSDFERWAREDAKKQDDE